jgi:hypothetical protein
VAEADDFYKFLMTVRCSLSMSTPAASMLSTSVLAVSWAQERRLCVPAAEHPRIVMRNWQEI